MRRVVTGHTADGKAIVVRDDEVVPFAVGDRGSGAALIRPGLLGGLWSAVRPKQSKPASSPSSLGRPIRS
jgi:hypothetical protein